MKFLNKTGLFILAAAATAISSHVLARPSINIPNQSSRPLGVIGGVGPKSTAEFYEYTTEIYENVGGQTYQGKKERPQILIYSLPLDTNKEAEFIKTGKHKDMYVEEMIRGAKVLMEAGIRMAVIPCNTIHQFLPTIKTATDKITIAVIITTTTSHFQCITTISITTTISIIIIIAIPTRFTLHPTQ